LVSPKPGRGQPLFGDVEQLEGLGHRYGAGRREHEVGAQGIAPRQDRVVGVPSTEMGFGQASQELGHLDRVAIAPSSKSEEPTLKKVSPARARTMPRASVVMRIDPVLISVARVDRAFSWKGSRLGERLGDRPVRWRGEDGLGGGGRMAALAVLGLNARHVEGAGQGFGEGVELVTRPWDWA